ncbi:hypothetical protein [Nocardia wallacei]|uniref:hypothetical protein n=1 Tax=Nocardia wallacei TaxID=480035 RepID=UPI0024575903|nr:hypothetical protein [Nocardia wallacei]
MGYEANFDGELTVQPELTAAEQQYILDNFEADLDISEDDAATIACSGAGKPSVYYEVIEDLVRFLRNEELPDLYPAFAGDRTAHAVNGRIAADDGWRIVVTEGVVTDIDPDDF